MRSFGHLTPRYIWNRLALIVYEQNNPNLPWITRDMINILETWLRPTDIGLEFGSGRSTSWFASRVSHLTSVEDNSEWYQRWDFDMRWYIPVFQSNILAVQSHVVLSNGDVPIYKRLHVGGSKTIRGYPTGFMAGENIFLASMEYRFPVLYERNPLSGIHAGWAGVLFIDMGTAWYSHENPGLDAVRLSVGFGVHLIWDRWVLHGEYGTHGEGWGFINAGTGIKF